MLISSVEVTSWFDSVFIRVACCVNLDKLIILKPFLEGFPFYLSEIQVILASSKVYF